ncbi:hypothetical protein [Cellulomonas palmilytica]|uniref:hypothetical protein n=1 Tax=Cellulomonas palmilytica TaxID=2608402 RepID=UPI001F21C8B7|nr:hypothetical protein [Cellulomonas palmilytica]UJP39344.1 hypothetical protein F1D97_13515 [Cellulomonas palmilytica]
MTPVDYAHTALARENRERKARALADSMRRLGVTVEGIAVGGGMRRTVWRDAGLDRSPSEETWHLVHQLLAAVQEPVVAPSAERASTGRRCTVPACSSTDAHPYAEGWRCDPHSPWARRGLPRADPNRVPGVPCELDRLRAARAIAATSHPLPTSTVVDDRAIASGKRSSTTATYQAVRAAQAHHRNRRNP